MDLELLTRVKLYCTILCVDNDFVRNEIAYALLHHYDYATAYLDSLTSEDIDIYKLTPHNVNQEMLKQLEDIQNEHLKMKSVSHIEYDRPCRICKNNKFTKLEYSQHLGADEISSTFLKCINCATKMKI